MAVAPSPTQGDAGCESGNVRVARCDCVRSTLLARPDSMRPAAIASCNTGLAHAASTVSATPAWPRGHVPRGKHWKASDDPHERPEKIASISRRSAPRRRGPAALRWLGVGGARVGSAILRSLPPETDRPLEREVLRDERAAWVVVVLHSDVDEHAVALTAPAGRRELLRPVRVSADLLRKPLT